MGTDNVIRKTCRRFNDPGHAHELTFSCFKRRPFLLAERTRNYLAEAILRAKAKRQFHLWAYVVMPEHVHLMIWPTQENYSISDILLSVKQPVARRALIYLRKNRPDGLRALATGQKHTPYRFWQDGGGYDRNITLCSTLVEAIDYIHGNPVRRGFVEDAQEWDWSSARDWSGEGQGPIPLEFESLPFFSPR